MSNQFIGTLLINTGALFKQELEYALALQVASGGRSKIGTILIEQGFSEKESVARSLAVQAGWPYYCKGYDPDPRMVRELGLTFIQENHIFPLIGQDVPAFVMPDSDNTRVTDFLRSRFGGEVRFYIGIEAEILTAISLLKKECTPKAEIEASDVKSILAAAILRGATDIHIEPSETTVDIRLRLDGVLQFYRSFPRSELSRIVNIFFNRSGISAGDFFHFHDARFEEDYSGNKIDVRLSHIPSMNGSSLVLRLLNKSRSAFGLADLGYSDDNQRQLMQAVKRPHGLILFTGPTGCGKTTSLYSLLGNLKGLGVKVVTAEDPVEVQLPLVTQVSVDLRREQDFHHVTRALLRHDPDIILIGEVRDEKTAREAVRAAVTGHRVLATLHTNDVVSAILRLNDLGIDYTQLSHTLTCIVSQRLVRILCPKCKKKSDKPNEYIPVGCSVCYGGFKGRKVIAEVMCIGPEYRILIEKGLIQEVFSQYISCKEGITMRESAESLIRNGQISRCELERILG